MKCFVRLTREQLEDREPFLYDKKVLSNMTENVQINNLSSEYLPNEDLNLAFEDT